MTPSDLWVCPQGTGCDLVTGEERRLGRSDGLAAEHVACTVEMTSVKTPCELASFELATHSSRSS